MFMDSKTQYRQPGNTSQINLESMQSVKISSDFFSEIDKLDPNIYTEIQRIQNRQKNLEKEVQGWKTYILILKLTTKLLIFKTV